MEDFYRLFQLSPHRRDHWWKNLHHAWRIITRPFLNGTNSTCHASHRRPRHRYTKRGLFLIIGLLCDLLWSDPDKDITGWSENDRGVSFTFGPDVVSRFLQKHDMDLICRAHQVVEDGYEFFSKRQLVTLFSAPNYCGEFDNAGAMMSVDESLLCSFQVLVSMYGVDNRFWNPRKRSKSMFMAGWELDDLLLHHVKWKREERTQVKLNHTTLRLTKIIVDWVLCFFSHGGKTGKAGCLYHHLFAQQQEFSFFFSTATRCSRGSDTLLKGGCER